MLHIEPIKLLKGTHADTAQTGQGCFMNVIAYLNGEPQITDQSPCVCVIVRPLCIRLNDLATDEQRPRLIPFIERAMGSATKDKDVIAERKRLIHQYGAQCQAARYKWCDALKKRGISTAAFAATAATASDAAYAATAAAYAAAYALKGDLFDAGIRFLDAALPQAQPVSAVVVERAQRLVALRDLETIADMAGAAGAGDAA